MSDPLRSAATLRRLCKESETDERGEPETEEGRGGANGGWRCHQGDCSVGILASTLP